MNSNPYITEVVAVARYQAQLQEAEHARLLRRLRRSEPGIVRVLASKALLAFGAKLTRMGEHLRPAIRVG